VYGNHRPHAEEQEGSEENWGRVFDHWICRVSGKGFVFMPTEIR
jgi:hypothetical protein